MHKPLKIVHVLLNYHPSVGGTQWLFKNISEGLVKEYNDEVTVLTIDSFYGPEKKNFKKISLHKEVINGVIVMRFSYSRWQLPFLRLLQKVWTKFFKKSNAYLEDLLYTIFSKKMIAAINTANANIICASSSAYSFTKYSVWRNYTKVPKPFVSMGAIHFENNNHHITPSTLKALQKADKYIANTEFEKKSLIQLGLKDEQIHVIGCGVYPDHFENANGNLYKQQLELKSTDIVLLFMGRQEPQKNITQLLEAFKTINAKNNNVHLIIAGATTWYSTQLQKIIDEVNTNGKIVHIISNFTEQEKANIYAAANIFVSASTSESFGIVFVEAWATKKPVIAANIDAIASVISNNFNGLLFEPNNVNSLTSAIELLVNNNSLQQQFAQNGYNTMKEKYTWPVIVNKYRDTYMQAIKKFEECVE